MNINKVGQLRKLIEDLEDDYSIVFRVSTKVSEEDLSNKSKFYQYYAKIVKGIEYDDIGVSDKQLCLGVTLEQ